MEFAAGDYVKFEIKDEQSGQSEWLWLRVNRCDELNRLVLRCLDSEPLVFAVQLKLGQQMAVSYENVRDHKKESEF